MSAATDLLASINKLPYDASTNPGGLADSGYLITVGGVSLTARVARAMGDATAEIETTSYDLAPAQADAAAIAATKAPTAAHRDAADASAANAADHASSALSAVPAPVLWLFGI